MRCSECTRFDREARACLDAKINPQSRREAVEAVQVMGVRSLCLFNDFRESLIEARLTPVGRPAPSAAEFEAPAAAAQSEKVE